MWCACISTCIIIRHCSLPSPPSLWFWETNWRQSWILQHIRLDKLSDKRVCTSVYLCSWEPFEFLRLKVLLTRLEMFITLTVWKCWIHYIHTYIHMEDFPIQRDTSKNLHWQEVKANLSSVATSERRSKVTPHHFGLKATTVGKNLMTAVKLPADKVLFPFYCHIFNAYTLLLQWKHLKNMYIIIRIYFYSLSLLTLLKV